MGNEDISLAGLIRCVPACARAWGKERERERASLTHLSDQSFVCRWSESQWSDRSWFFPLFGSKTKINEKKLYKDILKILNFWLRTIFPWDQVKCQKPTEHTKNINFVSSYWLLQPLKELHLQPKKDFDEPVWKKLETLEFFVEIANCHFPIRLAKTESPWLLNLRIFFFFCINLNFFANSKSIDFFVLEWPKRKSVTF